MKGKRGRGTSAGEKNPVLGFAERGGLVRFQVLDNVKKKTIAPIFEGAVRKGAVVYTDEYKIYSGLQGMGYRHQTVNHADGEYARDDDGDGFHEVHCNTVEGAWSLLRSWLLPHRGVSQEKLPFYVGYFEWVHNLGRQGKSLLSETFALLLRPDRRTYEECLLSVQR
jgi:transposase-like protein